MYNVNSRSWRLTFMTVWFVANVYEGVTTELEQTNLKQVQPWLWPGSETSLKTNYNDIHYVKPRSPQLNPGEQTQDFKKLERRISETKCLEYIKEQFDKAKEQGGTQPSMPNDKSQNLEVGGREALKDEFPHMGALGWRTVNGSWEFMCGSSLISPKFVVTAAHCSNIRKGRTIANRQPEIVRFGEVNIIDVLAKGFNPIDANIVRIIVHPQYSSPKKYYDIALVELESEIQFSRKIQPACLWTSFDTSKLLRSGSQATSTGWGVVDIVTKMTSPTLQVTLLDIIDSKLCNNLLRRACNRLWCGFQEHQLCAGNLTGGVDACQGDSGGPLQVNIGLPSDIATMHYLIGVTSFGIGCARPNQPGVFTRIASFADWIESVVWPEQL